jgi:16S rRNA (guanine(966)-N(2))-methyltransferase RsmD
MRIIAGTNKGKKLFAPDGMSVRPTSDKIKEAIFNIIGYIDEESVVLDLFAGTGNIGIEFLARGAKECYFVDAANKSLSFVRKNVEICNFENRSKIMQSDYSKALENFYKLNQKFDYIFVDPPYDLLCCTDIAEKILQYKLLKTDGFLIIESDKTEKVFENLDNDDIKYKEKIYGRTRISIIKLLED